jgi:hypothetical protein
MTRNTRFTPPFIPSGGAATATGLSTRMVELLFNVGQGRRKTALDAWENEGGSVAADTEKEPFSIDGAQGKLMPRHPHGSDAVKNAFYAPTVLALTSPANPLANTYARSATPPWIVCSAVLSTDSQAGFLRCAAIAAA